MQSENITWLKALLAVILGPAAIVVAIALRNPDGAPFLGAFRDNVRAERTCDEINFLVKAVHEHFLGTSSYGPPSTNITTVILRNGKVPYEMVDAAKKPPTILSAWHTDMAITSNGQTFSIAVPVSPLGCRKLLVDLHNADLDGAFANGQRQPQRTTRASIRGCRAAYTPLNVVTFRFK